MWRTLTSGKKLVVLAINALFIAGIVIVGQQMRFQNLAPTNSVAQTVEAPGQSISVAGTTTSRPAETPSLSDTEKQKGATKEATTNMPELISLINQLKLEVKVAIVSMFFLMLLLTVYYLRA